MYQHLLVFGPVEMRPATLASHPGYFRRLPLFFLLLAYWGSASNVDQIQDSLPQQKLQERDIQDPLLQHEQQTDEQEYEQQDEQEDKQGNIPPAPRQARRSAKGPAAKMSLVRALVQEEHYAAIWKQLDMQPQLQHLQRSHSEVKAHELVRFRFANDLPHKAYGCMAKSCYNLFSACSLSQNCLEALTATLIDEDPKACTAHSDSPALQHSLHNKADIDLFRSLLSCYIAHCSSRPVFEHIPGLVSPTLVEQILSLKEAAHQEAENSKVDFHEIQSFRSFGSYDNDIAEEAQDLNSVGHTVTFLHRVIGKSDPDLIKLLKAVALEADKKHDWGIAAAGYGTPESLKLRNVELIDYNSPIDVHSKSASEDSAPKHQWIDISTEKGCKTRHSEDSANVKHRELSDVSDLEACKLHCLHSDWCKAIDWRIEERICMLYDRACHQPTDTGARSLRLSYSEAQLGSHIDEGSLLTVSIALDEPSNYVGGELHFRDSCTNETVAPSISIGDVTIWPSHAQHRLTPVSKGRRRVLVLEFWEFCAGPLENRVEGRPADEIYSSACTSDNNVQPIYSSPAHEPAPDESQSATDESQSATDEFHAESFQSACVIDMEEIELDHGPYGSQPTNHERRAVLVNATTLAVSRYFHVDQSASLDFKSAFGKHLEGIHSRLEMVSAPGVCKFIGDHAAANNMIHTEFMKYYEAAYTLEH